MIPLPDSVELWENQGKCYPKNEQGLAGIIRKICEEGWVEFMDHRVKTQVNMIGDEGAISYLSPIAGTGGQLIPHLNE